MNKFFVIFILLILFSCSKYNRKIGIQPYGNIPKRTLDSVSFALSKNYNVDVIVLDRIELPKKAFVNIKSPRYRADSLLNYQLTIKPDTIDFIIGITSKDVSTTKKDSKGNIKKPETKYIDWGVFGLGYKPGKSCIISTYRIKNSSEDIFFNRVQKISVHEIGHNMGLDHCETEYCVMKDAVETIKTVDYVGKSLCVKCKRRI